jgi:phage gpG-like protein
MIKDSITPDLLNRIKALDNKSDINEAIGLALVSMAVKAFTQTSLRPAPWKSKRKPGPALYDTGSLKHSLRVISSDNSKAVIGSDRPYASVHQFGAKPFVITPKTAKGLFWPGAKHPVKKVHHPGIPARPFFPFTSDGRPTEKAARRINRTIRAKLDA